MPEIVTKKSINMTKQTVNAIEKYQRENNCLTFAEAHRKIIEEFLRTRNDKQ